MYLGRFQSGDSITLPLWCRDENLTPGSPSSHPMVTTYDDSSSQIEQRKLSPRLTNRFTGFFSMPLFLDANYPPGQYFAVLTFTLSGTARSYVHTFEVVGIGDGNGRFLSVSPWRSSGADYLMASDERGRLQAYRNPRAKR